jgi:hypothetical protein
LLYVADERIKRLKDLVDRLQRLAPSEDRDRVLREVRSRAVDLDTGVAPRAMLPVREPIPPRVLAQPVPKPYRPRAITRIPPVETASSAVAATGLDEWPSPGPLLSLEDAPEPEAQAPGAVPRWTLGLRG